MFYYDGNPPNAPYYVKNFAHVYSNQIISDSAVWTTISDTIIADSAYTYLVIGNFFVDSLTMGIKYFNNGYSECSSYYFIDDVSVLKDTLTTVNPESTLYKSIAIYPTITNGIINIKTDSPLYVEAGIFNVFGQLMYREILIPHSNSMIDISDHPPGIYIVHIKTNEEFLSKKIFLTR